MRRFASYLLVVLAATCCACGALAPNTSLIVLNAKELGLHQYFPFATTTIQQTATAILTMDVALGELEGYGHKGDWMFDAYIYLSLIQCPAIDAARSLGYDVATFFRTNVSELKRRKTVTRGVVTLTNDPKVKSAAKREPNEFVILINDPEVREMCALARSELAR